MHICLPSRKLRKNYENYEITRKCIRKLQKYCEKNKKNYLQLQKEYKILQKITINASLKYATLPPTRKLRKNYENYEKIRKCISYRNIAKKAQKLVTITKGI
jgi:hypothetical protein